MEINVQTIIDEVMLAYDAAPEVQYVSNTINSHIIFKISKNGTHRILNAKFRLLEYAQQVRKFATAFGGGLVKTNKDKLTVLWSSKLIKAFKISIIENDLQAVLDLSDNLGAMYYVNKVGLIDVVITPIRYENNNKLVSVMGTNNQFYVVDPITMIFFPCAERNRKNIIEHMTKYSADTITNVLSLHTVSGNQVTLRQMYIKFNNLVDNSDNLEVLCYD